MDYNTITNDILTGLIEDTTREEMESILVPTSNNSMPSIGTSVESCTEIILLSQYIKKFTLYLVSPLQSDDGTKPTR
jgi:hypothetical protein